MLNEIYRAMLGNKSVIRETFMYGKKRAAECDFRICTVDKKRQHVFWTVPLP